MNRMLKVVPAGAGAGKTYHIQDQLTKWVRDKTVDPARILAGTFTEAAAAELLERIRDSLLKADLIEAAFGNQDALKLIFQASGQKAEVAPTHLTETTIMLVVLGLIDVVMISNLLIMVIIGGYETFVSRLNLEGHPDQPEWLDHVNASVLKVKLATAIIGISSIHLLKTFINAENYSDKVLISQTVIHVAFLFSAMAIAMTDKLLHQAAHTGDH